MDMKQLLKWEKELVRLFSHNNRWSVMLICRVKDTN